MLKQKRIIKELTINFNTAEPTYLKKKYCCTVKQNTKPGLSCKSGFEKEVEPE